MSRYTRARARQVARWEPHDLISLENPENETYTCLSLAPSMGRRCRNRVVQGRASKASEILEELALERPDDPEIKVYLRDVVELCTCWRHNSKDNVVKIVDEYWETLQRQTAREIRREASVHMLAYSQLNTQTIRQSRSTTATTVRTTSSTTTSRAQARATENEPTLLEQIQCLSAQMEALQASLAAVQAQAQTQSRRTRNNRGRDLEPRAVSMSGRPLSEDEISSGSESSDREATPSPNRAVTRTTTTISALSGTGSGVSLPAAQPDISPSSERADLTTTCTETHVQRKPIEGDCAICMVELEDAEREELVWCKGTCGQNAHKDCMQQWHTAQVPDTNGMDTGLTCPFCRQEWKLSCEHDEEEPTSA